MSETVRVEDSQYIRDWLRASQDPLHPAWQAPGEPARGGYHGPAPTGLVKLVLEGHVMRRLAHGRRPREGAYWASEVQEARAIAAAWTPAVAQGMSFEEVVRWISILNAASAEQAAALFAEGVEPQELEPGSADLGRPSLGARLAVANMTVADVIGEVRRRRSSG